MLTYEEKLKKDQFLFGAKPNFMPAFHHLFQVLHQKLNSAREAFTGYRRRIVFKVPAGGVTVDLLLSLDKKELTMPEFDEMIDNIVLINP